MVESTKELICERDPLACLPWKPTQDFARARVIYDSQAPSQHLYLVVSGRVKITEGGADGIQTVVRIVPPDGFFGLSALLESPSSAECAVALDHTQTIRWSLPEIEEQIEREPRLGLGLVQYLVRHSFELQDRIHAMAGYKTRERVMLALVQLARDLGTRQEDGATRIEALTHETLAGYVGTSREIVTFQLCRLRRLALVRYDRRHLDIFVPAMLEALSEADVSVPRPRTAGLTATA